jgi:hypothetical protein
MAGYFFVFRFVKFCSDGGNEKQINTPPSEQNVIK